MQKPNGKPLPSLSVRIDIDAAGRIGPGKIELLETIHRSGSISAAGRANPIERALGAVHDKGTRNHTRKRMWPLVQDVKQHLQVNGPWRYALSEIYWWCSRIVGRGV